MRRGLGELLPGDPLTVRLLFEPAGRGHADDKYYCSGGFREVRVGAIGVSKGLLRVPDGQ